MPDQPEEWRKNAGQAGSEEEEGGPVKSFLEHLEDLRWVLIKSGVALGVGFLVCLVATNSVVKVLTYPLNHAKVSYPPEIQVVTFLFGTNRLGVYQLPASEAKALNLSTNRYVTFHLEPITIPGTNPVTVLGLRPDNDSTEARRLMVPIVATGPAQAFITAVQLAMYAGGLIASPFILYFVASFVFPALKMTERKYVYRGLFFGLGLFLSGVSFCYLALMPIALSASVRYTQWMGLSVPLWRADEYISFVCKFMLGMGLGFEMPVILLVLVKIGILNYTLLSKARRYVIVINFILGAMLTTPEILTQLLMALPLQVLYEITIWIAWYWERQEKKREMAGDLLGASQ
jgi:sec-independent protein translocase protein TatC